MSGSKTEIKKEEKPDEDHSLLERAWSGPSKSERNIRVFSWNILADNDVERESQQLSSPRECMDWEKRRPHIINEILRHNPDLIGLVELDKMKDLNSELEQHGYRGFFIKKNASTRPDGTGIFFKTDRFILDKDPVGKPLHLNKDVEEHYPNVFHAVQLKTIDRQLSFVFVCVHLIGPKSGKDEKVRKFQAEMTLQYIKDFFPDCRNIIIAGDFNAAKIDMLDTSINKNYKPLVIPQIEKIGFRSAYETVFGKEPTYTTWKVRNGRMKKYTVDFIMLSKGMSAVGALDVPIDDDVPSCGFPNFRYPSDHVALCADIALPIS